MAEVPRATIRQFAFNAPDARIYDVWCAPTFGAGLRAPEGKTRGSISIRLAQRDDHGNFTPVSGATVVLSLRQPFRLAPTTNRLVYGRPVFAELTYEAADGTVPLLWKGVESFHFTAHLV